MADNTDIRIGDIFFYYESYDPMGVKYYEVVDKSGKCGVIVKQVARELHKYSELLSLPVPIKGQYIDDIPIKKRVSLKGEYYIKFDGDREAYLDTKYRNK